ncbi:hypothetical protein BN8_01925 [Fibrisoma limi BUZ 3]|uniref:Transposase n=1 Tax=Fibrisoma limi BUZ 3 TaxID=1185876 RepID=I2GG61_9BACT|nr:hypothetical protein BN8_01925 [Fibrisoma limi BUZ 3]
MQYAGFVNGRGKLAGNSLRSECYIPRKRSEQELDKSKGRSVSGQTGA